MQALLGARASADINLVALAEDAARVLEAGDRGGVDMAGTLVVQ